MDNTWYNAFSKYTMKTTVVELNNEFISYLSADGIYLPDNVDKNVFCEDNLSDDENLFEEDQENQSSVGTTHDLDSLTQRISETISKYNGKVFVKINSKAPSDASWINNGTLGCVSAGEVYLLLKASDRISELVSSQRLPLDSTSFSFHLVIKKWANFHPSHEFRCFINNGVLVGICQRECTTLYDFLADDVERLSDTISTFFRSIVLDAYKFHKSYTCDVYVDKKYRVWIVDFNSKEDTSEYLLFDESILSDCYISQECKFAIVSTYDEILPSSKGATRGPIDTPELGANLSDFMKLREKYKNSACDSTSSDDDHK